MTPKIYQLDLIIKITQVFNKDVKSLKTFNTPATPHKWFLRNQETAKKISCDLQNRLESAHLHPFSLPLDDL